VSKKALAYIRVSGKAQLQGDGFVRQRKEIEEYTASNGLDVLDYFEEKAVPGKTEWEYRPAWGEMLARILSNGVRVIVIERLDRLARDLMVQEHIIADLRKRGIELVSTQDPDLGSNEPSRKAMRQMMGVFAEYEKSMLVLKLKGSRERAKLRDGRCEGRKPYGFKDGEREVLDRILGMAETMTQTEIAAALNAQGVKPRSGGKWWPRVVGRMLKAQEILDAKV
jgi:DNA invertase Pin-like site-specific DNA recombinase